MKFIISLIVISISIKKEISCQTDVSITLEKQIAQTLKAWVSGADPRLPSADPFILPPISEVYQQFGIKVTFSTSEMQMSGFGDMIVQELHVCNDTRKGSLHFTVPLIKLHADHYEVHGRAFLFISINCAGEAMINVNNADVWINIDFGFKDEKTILKDVSLNFTVGRVQANLGGCSQAVVSAVNKSGASILYQRRDDIATMLRRMLNDVIESF